LIVEYIIFEVCSLVSTGVRYINDYLLYLQRSKKVSTR
jgi:hypothetical protein